MVQEIPVQILDLYKAFISSEEEILWKHRNHKDMNILNSDFIKINTKKRQSFELTTYCPCQQISRYLLTFPFSPYIEAFKDIYLQQMFPVRICLKMFGLCFQLLCRHTMLKCRPEQYGELGQMLMSTVFSTENRTQLV